MAANIATLRLAIDARGMKEGAEQAAGATRKITGHYIEMERRARTGARALDSMGASARSILGPFRNLLGVFGGLFAIQRVTGTIANFEDRMAELRAVTGATGLTMERLAATAQELGAKTKFSASQAGEGLVFLARAGFTADQAMSAIKPTLDLAAAGALDLGRAADIVSNIMSGFGLGAEETARAADTLAFVSARSNTNIEQLGEAMKFIAPVARAAGLSLEETAAAVGVLGDSGIQASLAGTGLKGIISTLIDPSTEAGQTIKELGINIDATSLRTRGLLGAFADLTKAGLNIENATKIFSERQIASALSIAASTEKFQGLTKAAGEARGAAAQMAATMSDALGGSLKAAASAIEGLILKTGDRGLGAVLRTTVDTFTSAVRIIGGFAEEVDTSNAAARTLARSIEALVAGFGAFLALRLVAQIGALTKAMFALNAIIAANPIGFIATVITASVAALVYFRDELVTVGGQTATVGQIAKAVFDEIADRARAVGAVIAESFKLAGQLVNVALTALRNSSSLLFNAIGINWDRVLFRLVDALKVVGNLLIATFKIVFDFFAIGLERSIRSAQALISFDFSKPLDSLSKIVEPLNPNAFLTQLSLTAAGNFRRDFIGEMTKTAEISVEVMRAVLNQSAGKDIFSGFVEAIDPTTLGENIGKRIAEGTKKGLADELGPLDLIGPNALGGALSASRKSVTGNTGTELISSLAAKEASGITGGALFPTSIFDGLIRATQSLSATIKAAASDGSLAKLVEGRQALREYVDDLRFHNELIGKSESQIERLTAAREIERAALQAGIAVTGDFITAIQGQVTAILDERDRLIGAEQSRQRVAERIDQFSDTIADAGAGFADAIIQQGVTIGDAIEGLARDVQQAFFDAFVADPLRDLIKTFVKSFAEGIIGSANGNVFSGGSVVPFASGGVFSQPTFFPISGGRTGLLGEAGPEAIMPLKRGPDGKLGVAAQGSGNEDVVREIRSLRRNMGSAPRRQGFGSTARQRESDRIDGRLF